MKPCCLDCWRARGVFVLAVNMGDVWRCDTCAEAVWLRQWEASQ